MNIFDLENDLPDEIMASTSTSQTTSTTRNNFRIIPSADGNINKFRIRCEPLSSATGPVSTTTTSVQPETSSSSNTSLAVAGESSNPAPQQQSGFLPTNVMPSQSAAVSSTLLSQPQSSQSIHPTVSSQSTTVSSSLFPPQQSQNNQLAHPASSSQSFGMSSSSFSTQPNQGVFSTSSIQPPTVSSSSYSLQSQTIQPSFYTTSSTSFMSQPQSTPPPAHNSTSSMVTLNYVQPLPNNQPTYSGTSSQTGTVNWRPFLNPQPTMQTTPSSFGFIPPVAHNNPPLSHSTFGSSFTTPLQTNPTPFAQIRPQSLERRVIDMNRRWISGNRSQTPTGIVLPTQPTTSSLSLRPNVSPNVITITPRPPSILIPRPNQFQIPVTSVQNTTSADNVSSSNRDLQLAPTPTSAEQNATNATKEWQKPFNQELREHLVKRLVQSMFPTTTLTTPSMSNAAQNFRSYIEKMEREIYEAANSKGEYYHLMAEKHYKIHTELDKKRQARKAQQLQQQKQQQQQQSQNSQQDVEMTPSQSPVEAGRALDSNSNIQASNQSSDTISGTSTASSLVNNLLTNKQKTFTKEWHKQIGAELREILVKEFVQKMHPVPESEATINNPDESPATIDERIKSHVKNVECDIYQKADSRIEYYELLADRFCKIQEELRKGNFAVLENS